MKKIEVTRSQNELFSLERLAGKSVNVLTCAIVFHIDMDESFLETLTEGIGSLFPLIYAVVDTTNAELVINEDKPGIISPIQYFTTRNDLESWLETRRNAILDASSQMAHIFPYRIRGKESGILLQLHHAIADGWSLRLLYNAVLELLHQNEIIHPASDGIADWESFVCADQQYQESKAYQRDARYWKQVFSNQKEIVCLSERESVDYTAERYTTDLSAEINNMMAEYSKKKHLTPFSLLVTAAAVAFYRMKAQNRFFFGTLVANRITPSEQMTFGNCFNTVALPVSIDETDSFDTLSEKAMATLLSLVRHQRMSYTQIYEQYREAGGNARSLFDVIVNYQDMTGCNRHDNCDFIWYGATRQLETLQINIEAQDEMLRIHYDYRPDRITEKEVRGFHQRIIACLEDGIANDTQTIHQIRQISSEDWKAVNEWNNTAHEYPSTETICSMFENNAAVMPNAVALRFGANTMTYSELNHRSNALAHRLLDMGVKRSAVIGILTERSFDMMVSIYAALKCGAAYMPIGTDYPQERIRFMLEDSSSPVLLTQSKWSAEIPACTRRIDVDTFIPEGFSVENPGIARPEDTAYIIYTSGSTGTPKGAMIQHKSAVNRISWMNRVFGMKESDVILQKTPYTFDVSVWELFWWGMYGGSLAILEPEAHRDPVKIIAAVERYSVTKMHFVPSMLAAFLDYVAAVHETEKLASLRQVFASGEALLPAHVQRFYTLLGAPELINLYGPTECTVDVSCYRCPREPVSVIPIGKPIDNTQLYILDSWNMPVPNGEAGELCIGGNLVGLGYLNRPELTHERFIDNPFGTGRLYKTGDLARWNEDGEIEYLGRIDFQVKLHGQRIELGEIERRMTEFPALSQAVVTLQHGESGDDFLTAYYTAEHEIDESELRASLSAAMPVYMVPQVYMRLDSFPTTVSGKADRKKLPPIQAANGDAHSRVEPETLLQRELCAAFAQVLGIPESRVGIHDSFFDLGGTSLSAIILLTNLHSECEFSLGDIYEQATPARLEKLYLSRSDTPSGQVRDYSADYADCELNLTPDANPGLREGSSILLTGATGFLGVHLLYELLKTTQHPIVCLVRDPEKLYRHWDYMFDREECPKDRVTCVCGDLREARLGLPDDTYLHLTEQVGAVFHAAADVRHFGVWEESYNTNTVGTRNVIQFCWDANAQMHHISTMSVNGYVLTNMEEDHAEVFTENNLFIGQHYADNIYVHSKYLAEKSVIAAMRKGLRANIYRVGNLLWRSYDGKFQQNRKVHDFYMLTHAFLKLCAYPAIWGSLRIDFTSVDECAKAVCQLAVTEVGHIWHIMNPNDLSLAEYLARISVKHIQESQMSDFIESMEAYRDDPIMGFMLAYAVINQHITSDKWPEQACSYTVSYLESLGWRWSKPNREYLQYVLEE